MSAIGKTIARIEERPTDPEYGYARDDTLLIHFTDGTALEVSGSSYEEVSLGHRDIDDPAPFAKAAQGRREKERLQRLKREELASVSDEERARRRAARRAKMSPFELAMEDTMGDMARSMILDMNQTSFGSGSTFTIPKNPQPRKARRS